MFLENTVYWIFANNMHNHAETTIFQQQLFWKCRQYFNNSIEIWMKFTAEMWRFEEEQNFRLLNF